MPDTLLEATRAALDVQSGIAFRSEVVYAALVVLGLVLEYAPELAHTPTRWIPKGSRKFGWVRLYGLLGAFMVTLGVAGELYYTVASARVEGEIRRIEDTLLTSARKSAADALERAAQNEKEAGIARKEVEVLRNQNLKLQSDQLKLRSGLTWARMSPDHQSSVARAVLRFRFGGTIHVTVMGSGRSAASFASELTAALKQSGAKTELIDLDRIGAGAPVLRAVPPFKITGPTRAIPLMQAIVSSLEQVGIFKDIVPPLISIADDRGERTPDIDVQIGNKGSP